MGLPQFFSAYPNVEAGPVKTVSTGETDDDSERPPKGQNAAKSGRRVLFGSGELTRPILDELRGANGPLGSRETARGILVVNEQDLRDRKLLTEGTLRVSKALRNLKQEGS